MNDNVSNYCCVNTVADNKVMFIRREVQDTDKAREVYSLFGRPGQDRFEKIVRNNEIINFPVTVSDVKRALVIYGPSKERTPSKDHQTYLFFDPVVVLDYVMKYHRQVTLMVNFFYVRSSCFYILT